MPTGQVDQPGPRHLGSQGRVVGVVAVVDGEHHGFDAQPRRLGHAQAVPALDHGGPVGHGGGGQLDVTRWSSVQQPPLDVGHLREVLPRAHQCQRAGPGARAHSALLCLARWAVVTGPSEDGVVQAAAGAAAIGDVAFSLVQLERPFDRGSRLFGAARRLLHIG